MLVFYLWQVCNISPCSLQEELFDRRAGTVSLVYTFTSAWPLKGLVVEISHNAFSHRETSSQHEQGRNVAWVWERPSGWREGVTAQRAWSRRKEGSAKGAAEFLLSKWGFCFAFHFSYEQEKASVGKKKKFWVCSLAFCECICTWNLLLYTCNVTVATIDFSGHYYQP